MTTPGGAGTPRSKHCHPPCSAHRLLSWVGAPTVATLRDSGPSLCPGPMLQGVSYVQISVAYIRSAIPDDMGVPSPAVLGLSGRGYAPSLERGRCPVIRCPCPDRVRKSSAITTN